MSGISKVEVRIFPFLSWQFTLADTTHDATISARRQVLRWVSERLNDAKPPQDCETDPSFHIFGAVGEEVQALTSGNVFAIKYKRPSSHGRSGIDVGEIFIAPGSVHIRIEWHTFSNDSDWTPPLPTIVKWLNGRPGLADGGRRLSTKPLPLTSGSSFGEFFELVTNTSRLHPIILSVYPDQGLPRIDPHELAAQLSGICHFFTSRHAEANKIISLMEKDLPPDPSGGIFILWPTLVNSGLRQWISFSTLSVDSEGERSLVIRRIAASIVQSLNSCIPLFVRHRSFQDMLNENAVDFDRRGSKEHGSIGDNCDKLRREHDELKKDYDEILNEYAKLKSDLEDAEARCAYYYALCSG
ncbi:hypothetical protein [Azospirillum sp. TSO5]|uniref:hypothetical protein n=1 Tax=Azospirillum sp. TSO5 TaxID=716760 RepID=UPI0011B1C89B|nr:hypothetical protein [Azospirillum sp. TSO5]